METPDTFHQDKMENKPDNLCDNCTERYFKAIKCEMENDLKIVRLPEHFSQSKFTKSSRGSNACTLIVLLLSRGIETLQRQNIGWWIHKDFNMDSAILYALAESILQGNLLHEQMLAEKRAQHVNLSIPEAIQAGGSDLAAIKEWNSFIYLQDLESSLYTELKERLSQCMACVIGRNIYVILIALNRSVLILVEAGDETVTLFDSHQHPPYGSVIVQAKMDNLEALCSWYCGVLNHKCNVYELSFMYFSRSM